VGNPVESTPGTSLRLSVFAKRLAVCRLDPGSEIPAWATAASFFSVTRTPGELSIVCPEQVVPPKVLCERGWCALELEGPFDLSLVGVLVSVVTPLAEAGVNIFALATHDTDYVLVKEEQLDHAAAALRRSGHEVRVTLTTRKEATC
jgi:hypothetical protein